MSGSRFVGMVVMIYAVVWSIGAVPTKYRGLYRELDRALKKAESEIGEGDGQKSHCPLFATNLTAANANRGPVILTDRVKRGVIANLDAFREAGLTAVAVSIPYPVVAERFPRSREYRDFYRWVVDEVRKRGFAVYIESGMAFRQPLGQMPVSDYYRGLTPARYKREKREMIAWLVKNLTPDYLTIENEPDTQAMNTGMEFTPERVVEFVKNFLEGLKRGKTQIGAGAGTWLPPVYLERLATETSIDYIDIHIYPIHRNFFVPRVLEAAKIAGQSGKKLMIGEAWLYKIGAKELGRPGAEMEMFARDSYSFWIPLDIRFIKSVAALAAAKQVNLVSYFWPQYLFGYLEYTAERDAKKPAEILAAEIEAAAPHILAKRLSETGRALRETIRSVCAD